MTKFLWGKKKAKDFLTEQWAILLSLHNYGLVHKHQIGHILIIPGIGVLLFCFHCITVVWSTSIRKGIYYNVLAHEAPQKVSPLKFRSSDWQMDRDRKPFEWAVAFNGVVYFSQNQNWNQELNYFIVCSLFSLCKQWVVQK